MNHREILEQLDDYVDGALGGQEMKRIEEHLAGCAACREALGRIGAYLDDAAALRESVAPPAEDLWPAIRSCIETGGRPVSPGLEGAAIPGTPAIKTPASAGRKPDTTEALGTRSGPVIGSTPTAPPATHYGNTELEGARRPIRLGRLLSFGRRPASAPPARVPWAMAAAAGVAILALALSLRQGELSERTTPETVPAAEKASPRAAGLATLADEANKARQEIQSALEPDDPAASPELPPSFRQDLDLLDQAIRESRAALESDPANERLQRSLLLVYQKQLDLLRWAARLVHQV